MSKSTLNKASADKILQEYGDGIIQDCYSIIKSGSPIEEYSKVELMIELSADDTFSNMLAEKAVDKCFGISLTKHDFSRGEDEPLDSKTVLFCECFSVKKIRPSIESLKNAEKLFNSYTNKLLKFATKE